MFSITFALVISGVYTCYGGTYRSDAVQHQVPHFLPKEPSRKTSTSSPPVPPEQKPPIYTVGYLYAIEVKPVKGPDQNLRSQSRTGTYRSDAVLHPVPQFLPKEFSRPTSTSSPPAPLFKYPPQGEIGHLHSIVVKPVKAPDQELRSQSPPPAATLPPPFAMAVHPELGLDQETKTTKPLTGPQYLPPLNAWKVQPDNQTEEDIELQRSQSYSNKTKRPFVGPAYLPATKSYKTLKLDDLKGEPRPWWHVGVYTKTTEPFQQICGGSIVRQDVVISAAHCFWADDIGLLPAEDYAVAGNKVYRPWNDSHDKRAQKSDVSEIKVPPRFRGGKTSFQDDLAVVRLETPFQYATGLRPICVDFDETFNKQQLKEGNWGMVAGWGYTDEFGTPAQQLLWIELPYVEIEKCINDAEDTFLKYITSDKICAGEVAGWGYTDEFGTPAQQLLWIELPYVEIEKCINDAEDTFLKYITSDKICAGEASTSRTLCKGDSGGGLAFWAGEPWDYAPLLRGVGSAASGADNQECNLHTVPAFTQIASHKTFLLEHVPLLDLDCPFRELKFEN